MMQIQSGPSRCCRSTDTFPLIPGGEAVAVRLPSPPHGRRYRLDLDASGGGFVMIVAGSDAPALTNDRAPMTATDVQRKNNKFWSLQAGATA